MNKVLQIIIIILAISFGTYTLSAISNFFNISFQNYGFYLFFIIGLAILYIFLPKKYSNIFSEN